MWWQPRSPGRHSKLPFHPSSGCWASHNRATRFAGSGDQHRQLFPFYPPRWVKCAYERFLLEAGKLNGAPFIVNGPKILPQQFKRLWHFCHSLWWPYILDEVLACPVKSCGRFLHSEKNGAAMVPTKDTGISTSVRP